MSSPRQEPFVSIIIPCYNGADHLAQALKSVQWQTWKKWECILIDDGSTDQSAEVFKKFTQGDDRFIYFHKNNQGLAAARNSGIDLAKGDYIQFLDDDDILLPQRLETCLHAFSANPTVDIVYTEYACFDEHSGFTQALSAKIPDRDAAQSFLFKFDRMFVIPIHSFLFKSDISKQHRFNPNLGSHAEDIDCWIRIALSGAAYHYVDDRLSIYRHSIGTLTKNETAIFSAKLKILENYGSHPKVLEYASEYARIKQFYRERLSIAFLLEKDFAKGLKEMSAICASASLVSRMKFLGWFFLMLLFQKDTVFRFRTWVFSKTRKQNIKENQWLPPEHVVSLLQRGTQ